ncbi:hypothetical protein BGZ95_006983 [Linnemannia exigua]|uniref:Protein-serine/threonine kinase n=1 Tax=Linnemannia exigua TaxID=604196 RepID=A0AAD4DFI5_9FUNG|nr:hypothetical protein BGZ95_006983 [Linnemannia exigua]
MGHRLTSQKTATPLIVEGSLLNTSKSALAYQTILRSAIGSSLTTTTRRGFFTNSEQKEVEDVVSFYDDKVTQYANQEIQTVTLKTLLGLGRSGTTCQDHHQRSEAAGDLAINLDVARYARKELPVRLARLIKATQKLPFIVGTNPYIKRVYKLYYDSFQSITASPEEIRDKDDLDSFAALLKGLVESHADVVPMLSQGFLECKKYMAKEDIKRFLDDMIRARIGIRLIAEQAISLREQRHEHEASPVETPHNDIVGVVHTELRPADLIRTCASFVQELCDVNYGSSPEVVINGQTDTTFTYVPVHLEYILCELLKNSVRATVEQSQKLGRSALNPHGNGPERRHQESGNSAVIINQDDDQDVTKRPNEFGHPPVEVTIAQGDHEVTIRIRDHGGGISQEDFAAVFDYSFTTVKNENESSGGSAEDDSPYGVDNIFKGVSRLAMQAGLGGPIAGLGFGLPLTRIYAQYFGGDMHLISLQGHGCDVFLKLKQIDESLDDLQI